MRSRRHKEGNATNGDGLGLLILRGVVGSLFVAHGLQKLQGWFDGPGLDGTAMWFDSIGLRPGRRNARAAGTTEALGGALMVTGLGTPLSAAMITGTMAVAIKTVNGPRGMWATNHGVEYNLVLLAAAFTLGSAGPGLYSLDRRLGIEVKGPTVGLGQLVLGLAGAVAVIGAAAGAPTPTKVGTNG